MAKKQTKSKKSTAVARRGEQVMSLADLDLSEDEARELAEEQMKGVKATFPIIKILHAGAEMFKIGDDKVEELEGIMVFHHKANAYWETPYDEAGSGQPPDCVSLDACIGKGNPGGVCEECSFNQFGSAPTKKKNEESRGKACKNTDRIYFVQDADEEIPHLLTVPPSSLKVADRFYARLMADSKKLPIQALRVNLSLNGKTNAGGIDFSELDITVVEPVSKEEFFKIKALKNTWKQLMLEESITREHVGDTGRGSGGDEEDDEPVDVTPKQKRKPAKKQAGKRF